MARGCTRAVESWIATLIYENCTAYATARTRMERIYREGPNPQCRRGSRLAESARSALGDSDRFCGVSPPHRLYIEAQPYAHPTPVRDGLSSAYVAPGLRGQALGCQGPRGVRHRRRAEGSVERSHVSVAEGVEMDPTYADAWNNLGIGYEQLGRFDDARNAYEKALEIDPETPSFGTTTICSGKSMTAKSSPRSLALVVAFGVVGCLTPTRSRSRRRFRRSSTSRAFQRVLVADSCGGIDEHRSQHRDGATASQSAPGQVRPAGDRRRCDHPSWTRWTNSARTRPLARRAQRTPTHRASRPRPTSKADEQIFSDTEYGRSSRGV